MNHPWITTVDTVLSARNLNENLAEFRKYNARRKLKSAMKSVLFTMKIKKMVGSVAETINAENEAAAAVVEESAADVEQTNVASETDVKVSIANENENGDDKDKVVM